MYPTLYYIKEKTITIVCILYVQSSPTHSYQPNFTQCALEKCLAAATIPAAGSCDPALPGRPESSTALAEPKQANYDATAPQTP